MSAGRGLTIERMAELGQVSRSGFYRFDEDGETGPDPDMDLSPQRRRPVAGDPGKGQEVPERRF